MTDFSQKTVAVVGLGAMVGEGFDLAAHWYVEH